LFEAANKLKSFLQSCKFLRNLQVRGKITDALITLFLSYYRFCLSNTLAHALIYTHALTHAHLHTRTYTRTLLCSCKAKQSSRK